MAERDGFEQQWKAKISEDLTLRTRSLSDASESLRKATLRRELVDLRADQDAVVLTVAKVSVGSVMQSGEQLITLVPTECAARGGNPDRRCRCRLRPSRAEGRD